MRVLFTMSVCLTMAGCASQPDDPSMFVTGNEELAVLTVDGQWVCEHPKKELICHIPPGNPDNAHTICVGAPAVAPHQRLHGDTLGPCANGDGDGGDGDMDPGDGDGDGDTGDTGDTGGDGGDGGGVDAGTGDPPPVD